MTTLLLSLNFISCLGETHTAEAAYERKNSGGKWPAEEVVEHKYLAQNVEAREGGRLQQELQNSLKGALSEELSAHAHYGQAPLTPSEATESKTKDIDAVKSEETGERSGTLILENKLSEESCLLQFSRCRCNAEDLCLPHLKVELASISPALAAKMNGISWNEECPVPFEELKILHIPHWNLKGEVVWGDLIVRDEVAEDIQGIFSQLYSSEFPIELMQLVYHFDGDDDKSMNSNNTSSFNCRRVGGTSRWSEHAYGEAIDINPAFNPWVRGSRVEPQVAASYVDRTIMKPGMVGADDVVVTAFQKIGWSWGGNWSSSKDYQHFSRHGR
jgi:hypothetical protein